MKKSNRSWRALPVAMLCLFALSGAAAFALEKKFALTAPDNTGQPEIKVMLSGSVRRESGSIPIEKVSAVNPGEILDWTIISENEGDASAHEYKAVGQIPEGTSFVAGSVSADGTASVTYSIDGGKNYSAQPTIEEKQPDGSVKRVPAPVSMYTQIRYEWTEPLADGGKLSASYKVRVK